MAKKVYIGNLNYQTTEDTIRALFAEYGEVESANLITDRYSGRSRGFAFVEMASDETAEAAITGLNGKTVDEWEIKVAEAKPRKDEPDNRQGGDRW